MNTNHFCVIMAGSSGNWFWPVSREQRPKEFLNLTGKPFLRETYDRFCQIVPKENILVVTLDKYKEGAKEILPDLADENLLIEPYGRHTCPCMAYAVYTILKRNPEAVIVSTPSDHIIEDEDRFNKVILSALDFAEKHPVLMTLGIVPKSPSDNYGYIQVTGGRHAITETPLQVKTFTEKPSEELARVFIRTGEFYWNSGIYIWAAKTIQEEMERLCPEVTNLFVGWEENIGTRDEKAFIERAYADCPKISLDHGVMEKTDDAWLFPADFGWWDIGSWDSLYDWAIKDRRENAVRVGKLLADESKGNLIIARNPDKLVAISDVRDSIIIDTDDVLLICPRNNRAFKDFISDIAMPEYEEYR